MSGADSTDAPHAALSPLVRAAADGRLPDWSRVTPPRRAHIERVVALLDEWARALRLPEAERERWRAAGWLHDALRDAPAEELVPRVPEPMRAFPAPLLHGPAAAERLAGEADEGVRGAVRYHTIGHPGLDRLGRALYLADFLEPGRDFEREWTASLRARMPRDLDAVLIEVVAARIRHLLETRKPIRPETAAFWSSLAGVKR